MANNNNDKAAIEASLTLPAGIPNYSEAEWDKLTKKQKLEIYRRYENNKRNNKIETLKNAKNQNWINDLRTWYAQNTYGTNWTNTIYDAGELNTNALVSQSPQLEFSPQKTAQNKIDATTLLTAKRDYNNQLIDQTGKPINEDGSIKEFDTVDTTARIYPWRKVNGYDPNLTDKALNELGIPRGQFAANLAGNRSNITVSNYQIYGMPGGGKRQARYNGSGLVNENNVISRRKYDLSVIDNGIPIDARIELNAMLPEERLMVLNELHRVGGFYNPNVKVSSQANSLSGWMEDDARAMATFLDYSNEHLQTWQSLLPSFGSTATAVGKGSTFNVTSTNDIVAIVDEVFLADTGRKPTKMQWTEMAKKIQASQRTENAQNMNPSNVAVIADQMVRGSNPGESASYGLGNAMALAFKALGQ